MCIRDRVRIVGISTEQSSCWKFSSIAINSLPIARDEPFNVCGKYISPVSKFFKRVFILLDWKSVQLDLYNDWAEFLQRRKPRDEQLYFFEEDGSQSFYLPTYHPESYLVFGCESKGLPKAIRESMKHRTFALPMKNKSVKSLNLANVATTVVYQAMRDYF